MKRQAWCHLLVACLAASTALAQVNPGQTDWHGPRVQPPRIAGGRTPQVFPRKSGYEAGAAPLGDHAAPVYHGPASPAAPASYRDAPPANTPDDAPQRPAYSPLQLQVPPAPAVDSPATPAGGLTLTALEELALRNNPTLRQAAALVDQAQGNWLQSGLYPNPTAGYVASEIGNEGEAGQHGVFVSQDVVTADKLKLNRVSQSWDVERARWQAEAQRQRVLNAVRVRYYTLLGAQQTVTVAEQLSGTARQGVEIAEQLLGAQQTPRTDVLQAQVDLNSVQLLLRTSRRQEEAARRDLAAVVGVAELPPGPLSGSLSDDVGPADYEADWQRLEATSPVLQAARAQVARARAQLRRAQVEPVPDVQLQGSVQQDFATDSTVFGAQVGVTLPVFNRNQGNIAAAAAEVRRASENVARVQLALRQQLAEAHRRYEVARAQVEVYRDEILPNAQQTLQLTTEAYRAGELDFLRVLTARRTFIQARVNFIAALTELRVVRTEVEGLLLTGGLDDPEDLTTAGAAGVGGVAPPQPANPAISP